MSQPEGKPFAARRMPLQSTMLIVAAWIVLQFGGIFTPGLLDDVDSVYTQIAREMLARHDYVTPTIDGIRFFDKPPLMYWMAAGSMRIFGQHDWAARFPLALGVLALLFAVYALANRFYARENDRPGLYAALGMATSIGTYLYTRFYIPDILIALWMTLSIHLFLIALGRIRTGRSAAVPMCGFGAVIALDVLTKGLIGIVFPLAFVALYLFLTKQLRSLVKLHPALTTIVFAIVAVPWHVLAALRNPAIAMPIGVGLPPRAGWAWFYLYNEHIARFLQKRIPHDYGQTPVWLFWLLLLIWLVPWAAFLPGALVNAWRTVRDRNLAWSARSREAALSLLLWPAIVLGFFTFSARQEYYHLPALPALAILAGGALAAADAGISSERRNALRGALWFLAPLGTLLFCICGYFALTAPTPHAGVTLSDVLSSNPDMYNVSLGHIFDLTGQAMGFFRGPLLAVALCMLALGPVAYFVRRAGKTFAANMLVAAGMTGVLLGAHEGLVRFNPILGSKPLALAIDQQLQPGDVLIIDGELTSGSTLLFYTPLANQPVLLVNGRMNGPWFGSFWPDAPHVFIDDAQLRAMWSDKRRIFLLTYHASDREKFLAPSGDVIPFAESGGKTILTNRAHP